jgi:hypothetical protein
MVLQLTNKVQKRYRLAAGAALEAAWHMTVHVGARGGGVSILINGSAAIANA